MDTGFQGDPRALRAARHQASRPDESGRTSEITLTHSLAHVTLLVRDYDEAIAFFTHALAFRLIEDTPLGEGKRWVLVAPQGSVATSLLLARASTPEEESQIGHQAGGRVFLFLYTDDFGRDYKAMRNRGVTFAEAPRMEAYGTVAVFKDLYGNKWDLLEPRPQPGSG
jgi:catechol 2,3-dioxygenase-like lactoylglutathione lyase family enzyme